MKLQREHVEDMIALSAMQEAMLFHHLSQPHNDQYAEQIHLVVEGDISLSLFQEAWDFVARSNEMLRTVFRWEGLSVPAQIILKAHPVDITYYDMSKQDTESEPKSIKQLVEKEREKPFDLRCVPFRIALAREKADLFHMIISHHHILYDGWSNGILIKEFMLAYRSLREGTAPTSVEKPQYKEFIRHIQKEDRQKQRDYWSAYLEDYNVSGGIFKKKNMDVIGDFESSYDSLLPHPLRLELDAFVKEKEVTLAGMFYAAWGLVLHKYNDCSDVVIGTAVSGRALPIKGINYVVGMFMNTVPLRIKAQPEDTAQKLLMRLNKDLETRNEYEQTPLAEIKQYIEFERKREFFDSILIIENYPIDRELLFNKSQLKITAHESRENATNYPLTVVIKLFSDYEMSIKYNPEVFEKSEIEDMMGEFLVILEKLINAPDQDVESILYRIEQNHDIMDDLEIEFDL